jgi:ABC-type histidine transport system ATPase subunit
MEASAYARKFSKIVNFVYNGNIQEVGPNDILFEKRPPVIKG